MSADLRVRRGWRVVALTAVLIIPVAALLALRNPAEPTPSTNRPLVHVGEDVIAVINGEPIIESQWEALVEPATPAQSRRLLAGELRRRATLAHAEAAGYLERPEVRQRAEETAVALFLNERLKSRLSKIRVSDADLEQYLAEHPIAAPKTQRRIAIVFKELTAGKSRAEATQALLAARQEAADLDLPIPHFGAIAERVSDHRATRLRGGVLGYFGPDPSPYDQVPAAVHAAAMALASPGAISNVIATEGGLYLVRFVDEHTPRGQDRDNQLALIRERLRRARQKEEREAFFKELETQAGVKIAENWQAEEPPQPTEPTPPPSPVAQTSTISEPQL